MNLKEIYEIFYPPKAQISLSLWKGERKYRSKKEFFEEAFPMELRWINRKLWNDKARRSRFFADSTAEKRYVSALKAYILQNPMVISRMEGKCGQILKEDICPEQMNRTFFQQAEQEKISFSPALQQYLIDEKGRALKEQWGNVLAFLILYVLFPEEINQLYMTYLYSKEKILQAAIQEQEKLDCSLFQYEYPPDMSLQKPKEWMTHTWVIKNVGKTIWKERSFLCICPPDWLEEENRKIEMPALVYPGDMVSLTVRFQTPGAPGLYDLRWRMVTRTGEIAFPHRTGLGLHFTVLEEDDEEEENGNNNYQVIEEKPVVPATLLAGDSYVHSWTIENIGSMVWENYFCECINGEACGYSRKELRIPMKKKVQPGERVSIQIEFATPPIEGCYRLLWKIMKKGGKPAFGKGRYLEVMLNLI